MDLDNFLFVLGVGVLVSSLVILWALMKRAKENHQLEAADLIQDIKEQRERRTKTAPSRRLVPVPVGHSVGVKVLKHKVFEEMILSEALRIVNTGK